MPRVVYNLGLIMSESVILQSTNISFAVIIIKSVTGRKKSAPNISGHLLCFIFCFGSNTRWKKKVKVLVNFQGGIGQLFDCDYFLHKAYNMEKNFESEY